MKKWISTCLIVCILFMTISNIPKLTKKTYGWDFAIEFIVIVAVDQLAKWGVKKVRSKNGSKTKYFPHAGYGYQDRYWDVDDLEGHFKSYRNDYSFKTNNPPKEALATLPKNPAHIFKNNPSGEYSTYARTAKKRSAPKRLEWEKNKHLFKKGDIIFSRGANKSSNILQYITSWVHTGIIISTAKNETLESYLPHGVKIYSPVTDWDVSYSWSVKRIKNTSLSREKIEKAVDEAIVLFTGKPYFPKLIPSYIARGNGFISRFADKNNTESFYCSKLVWKTFMLQGLDLDSERTTAMVQHNFKIGYTDTGEQNKFAWIGVSGDDIYYSKHLGKDIIDYGFDNLSSPIPEWFF